MKDKGDSRYDPIGHVCWLMDELVANFNKVWSASSYVYVDECMVAYNGQYYNFKQYLPLKLVTQGIKVWCFTCSKSKFILNWKVYEEVRAQLL